MKNVKLKVKDGEFIRTDSNFRNWITKDGGPDSQHKPNYRH